MDWGLAWIIFIAGVLMGGVAGWALAERLRRRDIRREWRKR